MVKYETVKLSTGADLPLFGLGTWLSDDPAALTTALKTALDAGYPLIDTAYFYRNEAVIGKVLQEYFTSGRLRREDIFITTKLPLMVHRPDEIEGLVKKQLEYLHVDYFDLYLIHCPCPCKHQPGDTPDNYKLLLEDGHIIPELIDHIDTWKALEKLYRMGILKVHFASALCRNVAIGLSNFNEKQMQYILDHATVKPHNLQVEAHIYWPQKELYEFCKKNNITMTSYATLGSPGRKVFNPDFNWPTGEPMKDPLVLQLAEKYKKSPAQVLLRHMTQRGISTIPKSTNPDRILENFNIFDFKLTEEDIKQLDDIKTRVRLFIFNSIFDHPWYPFEEIDLSKMKRVYLKD
uniref:Aldo_ket_red domain-containing protein n=1 Tax=Elaeophora elaphi TaxID=1147741 RepID=A0A0R3S7D4_9BILA